MCCLYLEQCLLMTINKFISTLFDCYIKKIVSLKVQKQSKNSECIRLAFSEQGKYILKSVNDNAK